MLKSSDISFSDQDFISISEMAAQMYGIKIPTTKKDLLHARIAKRIRLLGLPSIQEYMDRVSRSNEAGEQESFLTLLTTNTTSFFRENHHFEFLEDVVLPRHGAMPGGKAMRIWSAGCSYGQEPYSISATVDQHRRRNRNFRANIYATDVDKIVLEKAMSGEYGAAEHQGLSDEQELFLFGGSNKGAQRVTNELSSVVKFDVLNLMDNFEFEEQFDVIFCRNVVIYFGRETQMAIWDKFLRCLKPGGYLFIGHSERLTGPASHQFKSVGRTIYRLRSENTE